MGKKFRLCYVDGNVLYFTDNFARQWGDDWDDAPYEWNAGKPYDRAYYTEYDDEWCVEHGKGNIRCIAYMGGEYYIKQPKDGHTNSPYSVDMINKGAVPWLYCDKAGALLGGATMAEAKRWLKKAGVKWGEMRE